MNPDTFLEKIRQHPLEAFRLCVTDGASYEIRHPEMVLTGRNAVVIGLPGEPNRPADRLVTIAMLHVTRLEPLDVAKTTGNGQ
jgi:hypothetical protein